MSVWYFLLGVLIPLVICLGIIAGLVFLVFMAIEWYKEEFKR